MRITDFENFRSKRFTNGEISFPYMGGTITIRLTSHSGGRVFVRRAILRMTYNGFVSFNDERYLSCKTVSNLENLLDENVEQMFVQAEEKIKKCRIEHIETIKNSYMEICKNNEVFEQLAKSNLEEYGYKDWNDKRAELLKKIDNIKNMDLNELDKSESLVDLEQKEIHFVPKDRWANPAIKFSVAEQRDYSLKVNFEIEGLPANKENVLIMFEMFKDTLEKTGYKGDK